MKSLIVDSNLAKLSWKDRHFRAHDTSTSFAMFLLTHWRVINAVDLLTRHHSLSDHAPCSIPTRLDQHVAVIKTILPATLYICPNRTYDERDVSDRGEKSGIMKYVISDYDYEYHYDYDVVHYLLNFGDSWRFLVASKFYPTASVHGEAC